MKLLTLILFLISSAAWGQVGAEGRFDPRIETLAWQNGTVVPLRTTVGGNVTLLLERGEAVQSIVVGDPSAVDVKVPPQADSVLIRTLREPVDPIIDVFTGPRHYRLRLVVGAASDVAYLVRLSDGSSAPTALPVSPEILEGDFAYKLKGETSLRPLRVSDNGNRSYLEWAPDQPLPAVFAINALGEEETVDSYMRGNVLVIDRVYGKLVFRIGKRKAEAQRLGPAKWKQP